MADGGYDVADYRAIDPLVRRPRRGRGADRARRSSSASARSSTSCRTTSPTSTRGSRRRWPPARAHPSGSGSGSATAAARTASWPPNGWESEFGGPAWSRVSGADGTPEQWYLHLFAPGQPDLNWGHPDVRARARGDPALLVRPRRRRHPDRLGRPARQGPGRCPRSRRDHEPGRPPVRRPRRAAGASTAPGGGSPTRYGPDRVLIGEVWLPDAERFARYLRPDVLHTAFNFDFLACAVGRRPRCARSIEQHARGARPGRRAGHLGAVQPRRDPAGHPLRPRGHLVRLREQAVRHADRPASSATAGPGRRRCSPWRCPGASTSTRARSSACRRSRTSRVDRIEDPMHARSGGVDPGRDGCRVPLPWSGDAPPYGFSAGHAAVEPWLPQPADWARADRRRPRPATRTRCSRSTARRCGCAASDPDLGDGPLTWLDLGADVIGVPPRRRLRLASPTSRAADRPAGRRATWLASAPVEGGGCPPDTTAWLRARRLSQPGPTPRTTTTHRQTTKEQPMRIHRRRGLDRAGDHRLARLRLRARGRLRQRRRRRQRAADGKVDHHRRGLAARRRAGHHRRGQEAGQAVHEGQPRHHRGARWSGSGTPRRSPTQLAGGTAADDVPGARSPTPRGSSSASRSPTSPSTSRRCRTPTKFNPSVLAAAQGTDGKIYGLPTDVYGVGPALQPRPVRAGRARPRLAADHLGRGARGRQGDPRRDRPGRLRPDEHRQHRRLDADHARPTRSAAGWSPSDGTDGHASTTTAPRRACRCCTTCAGGRLDGQEHQLRVGHASTRRSPPARSACTCPARTSTTRWSRPTRSTRTSYGLAVLPLSRQRRRRRARRRLRRRGQRQGVRRRSRRPRCKWIDFYRDDEELRPGRRRGRRRGRSTRATSRSARRRCRSSTRPRWRRAGR